jgi:hypothetical protein
MRCNRHKKIPMSRNNGETWGTQFDYSVQNRSRQNRSLVSMLNPRIAMISIGWSPRMAG